MKEVRIKQLLTSYEIDRAVQFTTVRLELPYRFITWQELAAMPNVLKDFKSLECLNAVEEVQQVIRILAQRLHNNIHPKEVPPQVLKIPH